MLKWIFVTAIALFLIMLLFLSLPSEAKKENAVRLMIDEIKSSRDVSLSDVFEAHFRGEELKQIYSQEGGFANIILTLRTSRQDYIARFLTDQNQGPVFKDLYLSQIMYEKGLSPKIHYVNYSNGSLKGWNFREPSVSLSPILSAIFHGYFTSKA